MFFAGVNSDYVFDLHAQDRYPSRMAQMDKME